MILMDVFRGICYFMFTSHTLLRPGLLRSRIHMEAACVIDPEEPQTNTSVNYPLDYVCFCIVLCDLFFDAQRMAML